MSRLYFYLKKHIVSLLFAALWAGLYFGHAFQNWLGLSGPEAASAFILLLTATLWITEALPLYITSLGVLLLSLLLLHPLLEGAGQPTDKAAYYNAFFSDITLLFMGGFVLSALLNKYGIARKMANWMLRQTGSRPENILVGIILISALLSMWMSNTATAAMMFAIAGPIVLQLPTGDPFAKAIGLAIPFSCNIGGLGTPIGTPPNAIAIEYLAQVEINLSFAQWMLVGIPVMLILLALLWVILVRLYPSNQEQLETNTKSKRQPFSSNQRIVLVIFIVTIFAWLFSNKLGFTTGMVGLMVVIVSFGLRLLDTQDFRNISWDILFMLGGGLCLGVGLNQSGLTTTIAEHIPQTGGLWLSLALLIGLAALMTTFMSNTATANLLIPVAVSLPNNELLLAIAISMMCSTSMALPVSTPPNAIAFGSGLVPIRDLFSTGTLITLLALIVIVLTSILYLPMII